MTSQIIVQSKNLNWVNEPHIFSWISCKDGNQTIWINFKFYFVFWLHNLTALKVSFTSTCDLEVVDGFSQMTMCYCSNYFAPFLFFFYGRLKHIYVKRNTFYNNMYIYVLVYFCLPVLPSHLYMSLLFQTKIVKYVCLSVCLPIYLTLVVISILFLSYSIWLRPSLEL